MTEGNDDGSVSSSSSRSSGSSRSNGGAAAGAAAEGVVSHHLVQVRAQVMMRDDARGGWLPRGGGGLSNVSVLRRVTHCRQQGSSSEASSQHMHASSLQEISNKEYLIYGRKISDQSVVLNCSIRKDFEYNKVMPTFHHWKTGDHKFGLTFLTAADARAFDRGVRQAVKELMDGMLEHTAESAPARPLHLAMQHLHYYSPVDDDGSPAEEDVFVAVNLPVNSDVSSSGDPQAAASQSSSSSLQGIVPPSSSPGSRTSFQPRPMRPPPARPPACRSGSTGSGDTSEQVPLGTLSSDRRDSIASIKRANQQQQELSRTRAEDDTSRGFVLSKLRRLVRRSRGGEHSSLTQDKYFASCRKDRSAVVKPGQRQRCRHCHELFYNENNSRGSCEYAPDAVRSAIELVTCIDCAQCMLYHCMSDEEGEFARHPCTCSGCPSFRCCCPLNSGGDGSHDVSSCGKRWFGLTLLSLLVPCLCCYLPLRACHSMFVSCGVMGGRHEAAPACDLETTKLGKCVESKLGGRGARS